jgi:uncharacterized membrane protein
MAVSRSLDRVFRTSVILKGIDGALEVVGGLILLILSPTTIQATVRTLTEHELSQDPHDFVARHLLHATGGLTHGATIYAGIYLLAHGLAKVAIVIAVLQDRLWAYPAMIALLAAFIAYQLYRLAVRFTIGLTLLTIFDVFVVWLTWREYQARRSPTPAT